MWDQRAANAFCGGGKNMKRWICLFLAAVLCISCMLTAFAQTGASARLYSFYGDDMLFAEKKTAVFAGTATGGVRVICTLLDAAGQVAAEGEGAVNKSGRFSVGIPAPAGGYAEYTAVLAIEGVEFARLRGIVFGALWLSGGQSNMQMQLGACETGFEMLERGETGSRWLRFLQVPSFVAYEGDTARFPLDPQRDIPGSFWVRGDDGQVFDVSAVSFLFAQKLQKTLDMPVGVLCTALGGSSIYSWLSRDAIESDEGVRSDIMKLGRYADAESWQEKGHDVCLDMTVNYNKKIEALRVFSPAGMIWYQGESDIFQHVEYGAYSRAFELLQTSWSRLFGFDETNRLPIVYTQIACFPYGGDSLQSMNVEFSEMQNAQPDSRAMVTLYDVPLTYRTESATIHPTEKLPVAARMHYAAEGLVYGMRPTYTAATVRSAEVNGSQITVKLRGVGKGLVCAGEKLRGFSICGADGVFVQAQAEICGRDTLVISAPEVPHPAAAAYAYAEVNTVSNLYASDENGAALPVSPFVTDLSVLCQSWQDKDWADCDTEKLWRCAGETHTGFFDAWSGTNAALSYADGKDGKCLNVQAEKRNYSVYPTDRYKEGAKRRPFADSRRDYSRYSAVCFYVRNTGAKDVTLRNVRLYTSDTMWYAPLVNAKGKTSCTIPADGAWHPVTLDLMQTYRFGNVCGVTYTRAMFSDLRRIEFCFRGNAVDTVQIDSIRFTPDGSETAKRLFTAHFDRAVTPIGWISAFWMQMISWFVKQ